MELRREQALDLILHRQLFRQASLRGKSGLRELIRQLGYVQIDTISVVERAHHHTIWSRIPGYDKLWLDELLSADRSIFEFWSHAASYLPIEDYRFSLPRMQRFPDTTSWERYYFEKNKHILQDVKKRIEAEGPLSARDFPDNRTTKTNFGWGEGKPEKIALELLLWKGELMVTRRDNFQRVYDLTERVLPSWVVTRMPSTEGVHRHLIMRSLAALGVAPEADLRGHFMTPKSTAFTKHLNELVESGEIFQLSVAGQAEPHYVLPQILDSLESPVPPANQAFLLSPFDNLVIQRPRLRRLFGFEYTLECYVTPKKRVYGYWCLPILYRSRFIGRLDCKANRKSGRMEVFSLHWEPDFKPTAPAKTAVQKTFDAFSRFCGCETVPLF